ncbi:MAG: protein kinase [Planctomycetaceae bacterium]|nr:protein kinase [Planctomycetaceae bacterium]MCA9043512.1 protein kinase [Planctomycetaceae bacterium]
MPTSREIELAVAYLEALDMGVCPDEFLRERLGVGTEAISGSITELDKFAEELQQDKPACELPPGTMVGRYEVVETLGRGATAIVYRAREQENSARFVTLKVTQKRTNESTILGLLNHPRIPLLIDSFENKDDEFATVTTYTPSQGCLEYLCGLDDRIQMRSLLNITRELAQTIQYVHSKGIIHCDIKPENMLISSAGQPILVDFGAATSPLSDGAFSCTTNFAPSNMTAAVLRNGVRELSTDFDFIGLARTFLFLSEYLFESTESSCQAGASQFLELLHLAKEIDIDDVIPSPHLTRFKGMVLSVNDTEQSSTTQSGTTVVTETLPTKKRPELVVVLLALLAVLSTLTLAINRLWPQQTTSVAPASNGTLLTPVAAGTKSPPFATEESLAVEEIRRLIYAQQYAEAIRTAEIAAERLPDSVGVQLLAAGLALKKCETTGAAPNTVYFDRLLEMNVQLTPRMRLDAAITYSISSKYAAADRVMLIEKSNTLFEASSDDLPVKTVQERLILFREWLSIESNAYARLTAEPEVGNSPSLFQTGAPSNETGAPTDVNVNVVQ